jgi:hypothetical protein
VLLNMAYVYRIVAIRVNETSRAHVWRLRFRYLRTGYDSRRAGCQVLEGGGASLETRVVCCKDL